MFRSLNDVQVIYAALYTPGMATHGAPVLVPRPCCNSCRQNIIILFLPSLQAHSSEITFSIISLSVDLYWLSGSDPLLLIYNSKNVFLLVLTYGMSGLPVVTQHGKRKGQHSLTSVEMPFLSLWFLPKVELFSAFISHLGDISSWKSFMKVQVSSI